MSSCLSPRLPNTYPREPYSTPSPHLRQCRIAAPLQLGKQKPGNTELSMSLTLYKLPEWVHTHRRASTFIYNPTYPHLSQATITHCRSCLAWIFIPAEVGNAGCPNRRWRPESLERAKGFSRRGPLRNQSTWKDRNSLYIGTSMVFLVQGWSHCAVF
jgi:hypothetical protein